MELIFRPVKVELFRYGLAGVAKGAFKLEITIYYDNVARNCKGVGNVA